MAGQYLFSVNPVSCGISCWSLGASMTLLIGIAQLNLTVGDMPANAQKIIDAAHQAHAQGARLLLTPELAICGYAAEDLFLRPAFLAACDRAVSQVMQQTAHLRDLTIVLGHPQAQADPDAPHVRCRNTASVLRHGAVEGVYSKGALPNYLVFDERRYFQPCHVPCVVDVHGVRVGVLICEDAWFADAARAAHQAGAELLAVINASPFYAGKDVVREATMRQRTAETRLPLVYAHMVGGQDELVFDGRSFALQADGAVAMRAPAFEAGLVYVQAEASPTHGALGAASRAITLHGELVEQLSECEVLWRALVMAVRDYVQKNRFPSVLLGLSGGIDSAVVLAIAVDALGADKVRAVMMPSPYTADISWIDAREMADRLGVRYDELSIEPVFDAFKATLQSEFAGLPENTAEENVQARIRGTLLMALSNKFGGLVLTTGNKSEMATGYCTLYGDMAGGFAVIKDVLKTKVFALARWRNEHDVFQTGATPIPERIITRPPSAELRADQTDQDSLPPYEVLDGILQRYMENDEAIASIMADGFAPADVERVTQLVKINEYKRQQAPVGPRLTRRGFGKDWRYPITNAFRA